MDQWMMIIIIVQTFSSDGFCLAFVLNEAWTTVFVQFGADKKPIQDVSVSDSIKKSIMNKRTPKKNAFRFQIANWAIHPTGN